MSKIIPISLRRTFNIVRNLVKQVTIIDTADELVRNDMTLNMLINKVSVALLHRPEVNTANDLTLSFRQNLLNYIEEIINGRYMTENREVKYFDDEGHLVIKYFPHIVGEREAEETKVSLFRDPSSNKPHLTLKGSEKTLDNKSKEILDLYSSVKNRVREVDADLLKLYSALEYEKRKNLVNQDKNEFKSFLLDLASETELYCGYEFQDHRKLDRSTRDYSLSRYGHAFQYGDAFQKWLIQPADAYKITSIAKQDAIEYLQSEFKVTNWRRLYTKSLKLVEENLSLLPQWEEGFKTKFTIDGKKLGKACQVISLVQNLIDAPIGDRTRDLIGLDVTNCGGVTFAFQFGDTKSLTVNNLIGDTKHDAHQEVADYLGIERDDAKKVMVAGNHGGKLTEVTRPIAEAVFGETYKGINALAEYGKKLLFSGVTSIELIAPDGVKGIFHGYTLNGEVDVNGIKVNAVLPFTTLSIGVRKGYSFGVINQHMSDAYVVRYVRSKLIKMGIPHLTILDAYYVPAGTSKLIKELVYDALEELEGWFDGELTRIEVLTGIPMDNRPVKRSIPIERTGNIF